MEKYRASFSAYNNRGYLRASWSVILESDNYKDAWSEAQDMLESEGEGVEIDDVQEVI